MPPVVAPQADGAATEDITQPHTVSPVLLPVAVPGAAIALPGGGALDFGERVLPPISPTCVFKSQTH